MTAPILYKAGSYASGDRMVSSRTLVWPFLGLALSHWALCSAVPSDTLSISASPRATLPISANSSLAKPSPPPYVIGLIIVGLVLLGTCFCWCCTRASRRHRSPWQTKFSTVKWAPKSAEEYEEKISAERARIQVDMHGRRDDDPKRIKMAKELRRNSMSPTVLHRTPTLHSPARQSLLLISPKTARLREERQPTI